MISRLAKQLAAPGLLLGICLLAFGLQTPWLGYYLDDWIILAAYRAGGANGLFLYSFLDNRPLVFWTWWAGFQVLGSAPFGWQVWTLFWRFLTALAAWLALRALWPQQARRALWAALLFAVYPLFFQQPSALTYSFHWFCFFLYCISLYWMIRAAREPQRYLLFSSLAILANAIQLFSSEFYAGLELLRPLVLTFVMLEGAPPLRRRLARAALHWAPYAALFCGYLAWRLVFMPTPGVDRNTPGVLYGLLTSPLSTLAALAAMVLQDLAEGLAGVWYRTVQASVFTFSPLSNLFAWAAAAAAAALAWLGLRFLRSTDSGAEKPAWRRQAFTLGLAGMLAGFAPGWATGRQFTDPTGLYNDRFGLAAMLGAGILLVCLLDLLLRPGRLQAVAVCLLIGLAVGQHFRSASVYRWSWEEQTRLFWQFKWRAPGLKYPTAILGNGALVKYIGSWANISAFNLLYEPHPALPDADLWYIDLYKTDLSRSVEEGAPIRDTRKFLNFSSAAGESIVLADDLAENQCLWIVSEADRHNPYLSAELTRVLPLSDLGRILPQGGAPPAEIFGREPAHTWCYTYQKARLAEQNADWEQVMALWDAAAGQGLHPRSEPEYVPFILAAAHTGRWSLALDLTEKAYFPDYIMHDYLCTTWRRIRDEAPASPEKQAALGQAARQFDCQPILAP